MVSCHEMHWNNKSRLGCDLVLRLTPLTEAGGHDIMPSTPGFLDGSAELGECLHEDFACRSRRCIWRDNAVTWHTEELEFDACA